METGKEGYIIPWQVGYADEVQGSIILQRIARKIFSQLWDIREEIYKETHRPVCGHLPHTRLKDKAPNRRMQDPAVLWPWPWKQWERRM
ncbi:MAG: hypothetical protein ACLR0U_08030 [Enterocloster clostridioformis]